MTDRRPPSHLRRAKFARSVQLLFAIAAAGFVVYRLVALFTRGGRLPH